MLSDDPPPLVSNAQGSDAMGCVGQLPQSLWSHSWKCLCILPKSSFAIHPVLNILFSSYCPEKKEWYSRRRRGIPTREHKRNGICIETNKWAAIKALLSGKAFSRTVIDYRLVLWWQQLKHIILVFIFWQVFDNQRLCSSFTFSRAKYFITFFLLPPCKRLVGNLIDGSHDLCCSEQVHPEMLNIKENSVKFFLFSRKKKSNLCYSMSQENPFKRIQSMNHVCCSWELPAFFFLLCISDVQGNEGSNCRGWSLKSCVHCQLRKVHGTLAHSFTRLYDTSVIPDSWVSYTPPVASLKRYKNFHNNNKKKKNQNRPLTCPCNIHPQDRTKDVPIPHPETSLKEPSCSSFAKDQKRWSLPDVRRNSALGNKGKDLAQIWALNRWYFLRIRSKESHLFQILLARQKTLEVNNPVNSQIMNNEGLYKWWIQYLELHLETCSCCVGKSTSAHTYVNLVLWLSG